ncbi:MULTISPECIES: phage tail protein [Pseudomonas]|uniref:Phage tail protein n=1 Tax=Pseudomonas cedrina TaxID=651740 RepID=A0A2S9DR65_PSECE|nr:MULTISPECIES: phage tail protein [Pseudomonas]AVJ21398.1 phage tail protein [Pseudomonas sp. MYb193]PRC05093.1 phage tail protein [Pseudomonas cedrina]
MASWFSEGTVTVTNGNAVVAGVGTKFSNCRSGDMFVGPDNGIYQVINPSSDTSVSISPAYRGATSADAAYGIVPVNGYPKALADAVNEMVLQWGATLAGLGDVSTENVVPVTKGGTGGITQAAARNGLGLGSASVAAIVGTVSQTGGVPTGAVIERGSNASGSYTKFADGTMICRATLTFTQALTFAQDGFFIGATPVFGFPVAFISAPEFTINARAMTVASQPNAVTATTYQGLFMSLTSRSITAEFVMTAQGRWF